jgi:uncharacterized protein (TIGR02594 family)
MIITPYSIAKQYLGVKEIPGTLNNPVIMAMLKLDAQWPENDETAWCSAFVNWIAFNSGVWRSKSLMARSWLAMHQSVQPEHAEQGWDVVILSRGPLPQPGPGYMNAPGHVGLYAFHDDKQIWILGGNQGDMVSIKPYPLNRLLGIRRW